MSDVTTYIKSSDTLQTAVKIVQFIVNNYSEITPEEAAHFAELAAVKSQCNYALYNKTSQTYDAETAGYYDEDAIKAGVDPTKNEPYNVWTVQWGMLVDNYETFDGINFSVDPEEYNTLSTYLTSLNKTSVKDLSLEDQIVYAYQTKPNLFGKKTNDMETACKKSGNVGVSYRNAFTSFDGPAENVWDNDVKTILDTYYGREPAPVEPEEIIEESTPEVVEEQPAPISVIENPVDNAYTNIADPETTSNYIEAKHTRIYERFASTIVLDEMSLSVSLPETQEAKTPEKAVQDIINAPSSVSSEESPVQTANDITDLETEEAQILDENPEIPEGTYVGETDVTNNNSRWKYTSNYSDDDIWNMYQSNKQIAQSWALATDGEGRELYERLHDIAYSKSR